MEICSVKKIELNEQGEYEWYRKHGGKLSAHVYQSVLRSPHESKFSSYSREQAAYMLRLIPSSPSGRKRKYINVEATKRAYGQLRDPLIGESCGWSDQRIFAEVLLMHHYVAAYKAFTNLFPNIFGI